MVPIFLLLALSLPPSQEMTLDEGRTLGSFPVHRCLSGLPFLLEEDALLHPRLLRGVQESPEEETFPTLNGAAQLGFTSSFGNTERSSLALTSEATLEFGEDRLKGEFDWIYAEEEDPVTRVVSLTQRRVKGTLQYDLFVDDRSFFYGRAEAYGDHGQDLTLRVILGAGYGYQLVDTGDTKLSAEVGFAHKTDDFKGASPEEQLTARISFDGSQKLTKNLDLLGKVQWLPGLKDRAEQIVNGTMELRANLGEGFTSSVVYEYDFDNTPGLGRERLDQRILFTLGYTF